MIENKAVKSARAEEVVCLLKKEYPDSKCSLNYSNPHELLVATILSAQCTDHRVNQILPGLFKTYPSVKDFALSDLNKLSQAIHSCGYHNQKAKSIQGSSLVIMNDHGGKVPQIMEEYFLNNPDDT